MATGKMKYRVLVVDAGDKLHGYLDELLPPDTYTLLPGIHDAGEARRYLLSVAADLVIINAPLPDEFGLDLAQDMAVQPMGVLLMVKSEVYEQICYKVEDNGVGVISKPASRQMLYSAVKLLTALSARLQNMERKNQSLQEKMADIRLINRAKWLLIENLHMAERDAHYYIEKQAMDTRRSRREVAAAIIRTYE